MEICDYKNCRENFEMSNPKIFLERLELTGYRKYRFCNIKHFLGWVLDEYKRKIKKLGWKKKK